MISSLAKLSIENPEKWYNSVNDVQKYLNSTYQRAIQTTPFELMFGVQMKNKLSIITQTIDEEIRNDFNSERENLRLQARDAIHSIQAENRKQFNSKRKPAKQYQVDDLVSIAKTQFATGAKLKPKNVGPYKIVKVKGNDRYDVERVGIHERPFKTNSSADNMKAWPRISIIRRLIPQLCTKSMKFEGSNLHFSNCLQNFHFAIAFYPQKLKYLTLKTIDKQKRF